MVSWGDAVLYCNARSKRDSLDSVYTYTSVSGTPGDGSELNGVFIDTSKKGYRLPTDAEWEYACRAGTTTEFYWGNDTTTTGDYTWYWSNSDSVTHNVATKIPNVTGLYDMAGNVWEWCNDFYSATYYTISPSTNPGGPSTGTTRVVRGGGRYNGPTGMKSANRDRGDLTYREKVLGFRVVLPS